jgi:PAS domain S-box-containing protein
METEESVAPLPKINILLVDDSPQNLVALEAILADPHRNIVKSTSGQNALKYLLEDEVGVILLDVKMDGMNGYETAALIRSRDKTRDVPIIFLTAHNKDDKDVARGYSYGAVDFIFKPVSPEVLQAKVHCFVELAKRTVALKQKNEALERAETELLRTKAAETLIKHAPDPVFVSDLHARILRANDAASELLGLQMEELVEHRFANFLTPEETEQLTEALREVVKSGVTRNVHLHPRSATGEMIPTTLNASALRNFEGQVIGAIGILRDMRAYYQVMKDLEASKSELQEKVLDLERFEQAVIGRELRLIEVQKENEALRQELERLNH